MAKQSKDEVRKRTSSWKDAAQWYVERMNEALKGGYFEFDHNASATYCGGSKRVSDYYRLDREIQAH